MKILFYSPVKLITGGGCGRWHSDITNSLKNLFGFEIEIIIGNLGYNHWSKQYLRQQLQSVEYVQLNFIIFFGLLIPTPSIFFFLLKKFKDADVVHFIHGFLGQDILILILKLLTRKKVVVGHHAPIFHSSKIHNFYMKYISRFILKFFDYHQALNKHDKAFLEKEWGLKNVFFIPSGVRVEKFLKIEPIKHNNLVFISVGRYALQKGYDLLLLAIGKFNHIFPNNRAEFWFVGDGELKRLIQSYCEKYKNIKDLGYVKYEAMPGIYAKSDVYLLPSREEPFGLVLIESWACGLPTLATKTEGPKDMLKESKNGWFIHKISSEEICNSLSTLYNMYLSDENCFNKIEKNCRETAAMFSIDTTAKRMTKAFFS
ncbi:glycosyltransferase family 4 protein [Candidatus Roizmanbacteria bacterium]|nr:glycosyltransferase family 4 protein [Candidatus Roizmanbacteria bacterium]